MVSRLGSLKLAANRDISGFEALQNGVQQDMAATNDLLIKGKAAQKVLKDYGNPNVQRVKICWTVEDKKFKE